MADDADTEHVTFTIWSPRVVSAKSLCALVDVDVRVAALSFRLIGMRIRRDREGLTVDPPPHRDVTGIWRPVIEMPEELHAPRASTVMEFLGEEGLAERGWGIGQ